MNNGIEDSQASTLNPAWLGWAWVLPQLLLGFLNWHAWILVRGDMTAFQHSRALHIGLLEAALLAFGGLAWLIQAARRKPVGIGLVLAALAGHTGYLWLFLQSVDRLLPASVTLWMLPQTELIFYQFSLMMPVVFLMLVRLARLRLGLSTPVDVGLSLAALVVIPSGAFILGSLLAHVHNLIDRHDSLQYLLIAAMVAGTAFILAVFLRLMIRLHDLIQHRSWSNWALPVAAGLVAPLAGLALNASIPFPYDFQSGAVYAMTCLNATALLIPFRTGTRWALPGWTARVVFYPFTVYFFLVFLPFLPLSLLAMIVAGAGFLILAPLFLFVVHSRRIWEQGRVLAAHYGTTRMVITLTACLLALPAMFIVRNEADRRTLNRAVDVVFSPDYSATRLTIRPASLRRALDRMDDMKHGIYLPYVSDIYNTMVFHGMVLPDEKADLIRRSLLGETAATNSLSMRWRGGFFGMGTRNERRVRRNGVTSNVVMASHEANYGETNGVTETEIRFVLENRGGANGEFTERITVPEGVLVSGFWLDVNGTHTTARIRERKTATWVYEMIRDMVRRDPGLVVYEDDQHLRLRVYPFAGGETRHCGLRFRFPSVLHPSIRIADTTIPLDIPSRVSAASATLAGGETALVIPAAVLTNWPSFRREVVAHLILDQSVFAKTHHAAVIASARTVLSSLPQAIKRVRLTWANFEQEDMPGEILSREETLQALNLHSPALPCRGGFCPERVISRVLLAQDTARRNPEPAGDASLFVVIPAPGSIPVHTGLAPFARLVPDLPAYLISDTNGLSRVSFQTPARTPARPEDFIPTQVVMISNGAVPALVPADKNALVFAPAARPAGWQVWNPSAGQFETLVGLVPCKDPSCLAGLSLWSRHRALAWTPGQMDTALPDLIKDTKTAGLLIPEAAFIVVETKSQEEMLSRKERQSLSANHALDFDEAKTEKAPAPPAAWLILPALWILWRARASRIPHASPPHSRTSPPGERS